MYKIPVYQPSLNGNEKKYVNECLDSTWISSKGKFVNQFEISFAEYIGVKHAATVSNGTVAIHLALLALGIGEGDEVIVPTLTYIASVNAIAYTGATPVFWALAAGLDVSDRSAGLEGHLPQEHAATGSKGVAADDHGGGGLDRRLLAGGSGFGA
jgi:hypothetical protein